MSQERHQQSVDAAAQRRYGVGIEDIKETLGFELVHDPYWLQRGAQRRHDGRLHEAIEQLERRPPRDAEEPLNQAPEGDRVAPMVNAREKAAQRLMGASLLCTDRHTRCALQELAYAVQGASTDERVRWAESVAVALGC